MHKAECQVCHKLYPVIELFPSALIRPPVLEALREKHPHWDDNGYICPKDLRKARTEYIEKRFREEKGELSDLDKEVFRSIEKQKIMAENIGEQFEQELTVGQRVADKVARWGGSWAFILLNLVLSCLAAIQAPIIMMSQNRQAARDRLKLDDDYQTNLMAELEIKHLHSKLDLFTKRQWDRMIELQQLQMDLLEQLVDHTSQVDHNDDDE